MKNKLLTRRHFIKTGLIYVPSAILIHDLMPLVIAGTATKSRTYSSVVDKRIALSNSQFAIVHGISPWTKIRIALRLSSTDTGSGVTGTPDFSVGLCSGTSAIYKDATTTHFIGVRTMATSWSRGSVTVLYLQSSGSSPYQQAIKRVNTTTTTANLGTGGAFSVNPDAAQSAVYRWFYFIDITKGSPNYTFDAFVATGVPNTDFTPTQFAAFAAEAAPTVTGHAFAGTNTLAVDEGADGTLDHVNLFWDHTTPIIEVSDLAAVRLT